MKIRNYFTTIGGILSSTGLALLGMSIAQDDKTILIVGTVLSAVGNALIGIAAQDAKVKYKKVSRNGDGIGDNNNKDGV